MTRNADAYFFKVINSISLANESVIEMTTEKKKNQVTQFINLINGIESAISINYNGLTVSQQQELRDNLRQSGAKFKVVKNTLFKIATKETKLEELNELLNGPTALVIAKEDVVTPATILHKFLKDNTDALTINNGYYFGNIVDHEYIKDIASIPPKEILLGKINFQLVSPIMNFINLSKSPLTKFQLLISSLIENKHTAEEAPAEEAVAEEAPAEEAVAEEDK